MVISAYALTGILSLIVKETGAILFYRNSTYHLLALSVAIVFLEDTKIARICSYSMIGIQLIFAFFFLIPAGFPKGNVIVKLVMSTALYTLIITLLFNNTRLSQLMNEELMAERERTSIQLQKIF